MSLDWKSEAPVRVLCHGVGGMGMAPLAMLLAEAGHPVVGKDRFLSPRVARLLVEAGVRLLEDDEPEGPIDLVVHSSALFPGDERLKPWIQAGVPVMRRGDCLASLLSGRKVVAIAGSHGKTTTTALLVHLLRQSGRDPGWMIGGIPSGFPPGNWGSEEWMIVEVDESDGTIGAFAPELTGWINLDLDHTDRYRDHASIAEVFRDLGRRTRGEVVVGPHFQHGLENHPGGVHRVEAAGKDLNAVNRAVALELFSRILGTPASPGALDDFEGIWRRQEKLREAKPEIWTDYAHHPTEISRFLDREAALVSRPCRVVFQPHRYTRTRSMAGELAEALSAADDLILLPVYGAGEVSLPDGQSDRIAQALQKRGVQVTMLEDRFELPGALADRDLSVGSLAFVGAGDVDLLARLFAAGRGKDSFSAIASFLRSQLRRPEAVRPGERLARFSTMGVGGEAAIYVEPENLAELRLVLMATRFFRVPYFILGRGSNLLISEEGFAGVVIRLQRPFWRRIRRIDDQRVRVGSGARLRELSLWGTREGDPSFAFLEGIPGSLGGALRMNAGAMGEWIYQLVQRVEVLSPEGEVSMMDAEGMEVGYRSAPWLGDRLVLSAELSCAGKPSADRALELLRENRRERKRTQPSDPSCGCVFRNPAGDSAGRLIDGCGLKGLREGGAMVSDRHANFILNLGGATADDVFRLICRVREEVRQQTGVALEPEVIFLGPFPKVEEERAARA